MAEKNYVKKIVNFLREDTWSSLIVTLILAFLVIKFIIFPILSFAAGSPLPMVIVESCSMHHYENGFEKIFSTSDVYSDKGISVDETIGWVFQDGFNKGDIIFVVAPKDVKVGDVIIFNGGAQYPLIHRVVGITKDYYSTKGDNYITNPKQLSVEQKIPKDDVLGKAIFRVPYVGWIKLFFYEFVRPADERGMCG